MGNKTFICMIIMKLLQILLINPNRILNPPVIPIGLEYLKTSLEKCEYKVEILDLCFEPKPIKTLNKFLEVNNVDIVGITIRNIDTSSFFTSNYILPKINEIVQFLKNYNIPIVLGGPGFSAMPNEILEYLKADYGVIGPGETAFPRLLKLWQNKSLNKKLINGWKLDYDLDLIHYRGKSIKYKKYLSKGGIVGFETHKGCENKCPYCIESCKPISYKKVSHIISEIKYLVDQGYDHFHLCDSEFNSDLNFSINFCRELIKTNIPNLMKWALYMKPYPYNEEIFKLLHKSNAYLITLSVDSYKKIRDLNQYSNNDLAKIIKYCKKYRIKLAIDLLTGYPNESLKSIKDCILFFKKLRPEKVGITFKYRIYNHTPLAELLKNDKSLHSGLSRKYYSDEKFLKPIFYSQIESDFIENLIDGDSIFRISGLKPGVNYQLD